MRPEYIKCIKHVHVDLSGTSWCGREITSFEGGFVSIDHAAENGRQEGRLVACPECVKAITKALSNGTAVDTGVKAAMNYEQTDVEFKDEGSKDRWGAPLCGTCGKPMAYHMQSVEGIFCFRELPADGEGRQV